MGNPVWTRKVLHTNKRVTGQKFYTEPVRARGFEARFNIPMRKLKTIATM